MKKYGIISNIWYALKNIWKWDKVFFMWFLPAIPLEVIVPLLVIRFPKILINAIEEKVTVGRMAGIIAGYFALMFLLDTWRRFCMTRRSSRRYLIGNRYELEAHEKFMRTDYANIENPKTADRYFGVMGDIWNYNSAEGIWESVLNFCVNLLGVATYGGIILSVSPVILLFLGISSAVTWVIGRYHVKWLEKNKYNWISLDRKKNYIAAFSEDFEYAKEIRLYNMSGRLDRQYADLTDRRLDWVRKIIRMNMIGSVIKAVMFLIQNGLAYWVLCSMKIAGKIELSEFTFYFAAVTGFSTWLTGIINGLNELFRQGTAIGCYREFFEIADHYRHGGGHALPGGEDLPPEIEFDHVSFRYGTDGERILDDISFKIKPGEKFAVVGENGAGKTTIVKLMCGLYFPEKGTIRVNGIPTTDFCIEEYYSLFSVVFQDFHLLPVSVGEFIASCREESVNNEKVDVSLEKTGLKRKIDSLKAGTSARLVKGVYADAVEFSGGEEQKLMLARALYKDAPVMILDEPCSALDPIAESELYERYGELTRGKTGIYISHRLASTSFCDRILFLENGKIAEEGTHAELAAKNGRYAYMYGLQSRYYRDDSPDGGIL